MPRPATTAPGDIRNQSLGGVKLSENERKRYHRKWRQEREPGQTFASWVRAKLEA